MSGYCEAHKLTCVLSCALCGDISTDRHQRLVDLIDGHISAESTDRNTENGGRITSWHHDLRLITVGNAGIASGSVSLVGATWSVSGEHEIRRTIEEGRAWLNSAIWRPGLNIIDESTGRIVAGPNREVTPMSAADKFPKHPALPGDVTYGALPVKPNTPREAPPPSPHKNIDPLTCGCLDCGATSEEIADGLAPACFEYSGPHALSLRALARTMRRQDDEVVKFEKLLSHYEELVPHVSRQLRTAKTHLEELKASFEKLKAVG